MGWFKKARKTLSKITDKFVPENEIGRNLLGIGVAGIGPEGGALASQFVKGNEERPDMSSVSEENKPAVMKETGRLTQTESDDIVKKTFSRLGRVFTSPLGLTGPFSTGKQKVFS